MRNKKDVFYAIRGWFKRKLSVWLNRSGENLTSILSLKQVGEWLSVGRIGKSMKPSHLSVELWKRLLGHLLSCWKTQVKPVVGGGLFSTTLRKFCRNLHQISRFFHGKRKLHAVGIPGTEFEPHPKDLDVKNQFFCLQIFVFHPNHNFSTILEPENQLKQENIFWNGGKRKTKKLSALFWFFAQNFFFDRE